MENSNLTCPAFFIYLRDLESLNFYLRFEGIMVSVTLVVLAVKTAAILTARCTIFVTLTVVFQAV
jgi:hypothetical protein